MKITYRVPKEAYAYVEIQEEVGEHTLPEWIAQRSSFFTDAFKPEKVGEGLEKKEFDGFLDKMLMGGSIHVSDYEKMDKVQQDTIQSVKRSQARIERLMERQSEA